MENSVGHIKAPQPERLSRLPLKDNKSLLNSATDRRDSVDEAGLVKRVTVRSLDHDAGNHAALNAQREVKRLKAQALEKDKQLAKLDKQLYVTKGQLEELQLQEMKHRNASKEIKKMLSSQETSVRAKSAALARVSGQLHRMTQIEENRSRRKNLQMKELNAEFEQMEETYCSQLCSLEEEVAALKASSESSVQRVLVLAEHHGAAEEDLRGELQRVLSGKAVMSAQIESSDQRISNMTREIEREKSLHQVQLLAMQEQYESLFEAATKDTKKEIVGLSDMQNSIRAEYEQQTLKFAKLYQSFEDQREEKIDAQLRVVSLVTDLNAANAANKQMAEKIGQLEDELTVARDLTEEVSRNSAERAKQFTGKISELESTVENLDLALQKEHRMAADIISNFQNLQSDLLSGYEETKHDYESTLSEKQSIISTLKSELEEAMDSHRAQVEELRKENALVRTEHRDSDTSLNLIISELKLQLKMEVLNKEDENAKLAAIVTSLCREKEALEERLQAEQGEAQATITASHSRIEELSCLLNDESDKNAELRSKATETSLIHEETVNSLKNALLNLERSFEDEKSRYETELLTSKTANVKLEDDRGREKLIRTGVITALKKENSDLRTKLEADQKQHEVVLMDLRNQLTLSSDEHENLQRKINDLSSDLSHQQAENQELEVKCANDKIHHEALLTAVAEKSSMLQALAVQKEDAKVSLSKLQADYDEICQQLTNEKHAHSLTVASHEDSMIKLQNRQDNDRAEVTRRYEELLAEATEKSSTLQAALTVEKEATEVSLVKLQTDYDYVSKQLLDEKHAHSLAVASSEVVSAKAAEVALTVQAALLEEKDALEESLSSLQFKFNELCAQKGAEEVVAATLQDELLELQQAADAERQTFTVKLQVLTDQLNEERLSNDSIRHDFEDIKSKLVATAASERHEMELRLTQKYDDLVHVLQRERADHESSLSKALQYSNEDVENAERIEVLSTEVERYKMLYEKEKEQNEIFMGEAHSGQKVRYVMGLKQQINELLEENRNLSMKTTNLNHSMSVLNRTGKL